MRIADRTSMPIRDRIERNTQMGIKRITAISLISEDPLAD
ncbi:hypothetical protein SS323385_1332 [Shigella sonnei 3233-85]|nr:hypothetical protein SS323385_1332 [Shigella sonnei 3233-85]